MTKIAIVTGGAQGIGRAIIHHFLEKGWRAVALDKDAEAVEEAAICTPPQEPLQVALELLGEAAG